MSDAPNANPDRQCHRCHMMFRDPSTLRRHLGRKRPCAPVVDQEELHEEDSSKKFLCRFCGRPYSSDWNVRRHMRGCPIAARGEKGMDDLYTHVLEKTRQAQEREAAAVSEAKALREELEQARQQLEAGDKQVIQQTTVNIANATVNTNVYINVFGQEDTDHISKASVREILARCGRAAEGGEIATQAIMQAALLIYSDPVRPGNLTCFIPNKRDGNALIHGAQGWEIVPVPLVLSPMARSSLELLFEKQPYDGAMEELEACGLALRQLRDCEDQITAAGSNSLRAVLIRNKDLLSRVLSHLPMTGESHAAAIEEARGKTEVGGLMDADGKNKTMP